nr:TPA_asm: RNA-dependent polymerase [Ourea durna-like virus]
MEFQLLSDSPWSEDHPWYSPSSSTTRNMVAYLAYARTCWSNFQMAPFPPGAKTECEHLPVCHKISLSKPMYMDVKATSIGKCFRDNVAVNAILKETSAPTKRVGDILSTQTKSGFIPELLIRNYSDVITHAGLPQHTVPDEIRGLLSRATSRILDRWKLHSILRSERPDSVPYHPRALAGVKYTGHKEQNFEKATKARISYEEHFLTDGFSLRKSTAFALLCRLQVSSVDNPKHRPVAADTFHRYLQDGIACSPWYRALKYENIPCSFGYNLEDQAKVRDRLLTMHGSANFELVADFPGFDFGKLQDRGLPTSRFLNGVRSWEIRLAFMILSQPFETDDTDATLSLVMGQAYVTFKKICYRRDLYIFTETMPSGTYWVYLIDSIICDIRIEMVSISLGDPLSARIVGGDDSYTAMCIQCFVLDRANLPLAAIGTELAAPPKTQIRFTDDYQTHGLKFHGHKTLNESPFREDDDVIASCVLLEREDNDDIEVCVGRLKAIWIDAGRRPAWLHRVWLQLERDCGRTVDPDFFWHERMWHAPLLLR